MKVSFVEVSDTGGYDIIILGTAIWALLYIIGVRRASEALEKNLLQIFGGFEKLLYLCIRNSKERGFRVSLVIRLVGSV